MSYNGSGTFTLNVGGYPYVANTTIVSANVNALLQDIANGLSLAVTRDGQMSMTGPLHMAAQLIDGIKNLQFSTTTSSPPVGSDGWFLTAAHTLTLATNGTNGLAQNSTGNVTIPAPSSGTALTINGVSGVAALVVNPAGALTGGVTIQGSNNDVGVILSNSATGGRVYDLLSSGGTSGLPQGSFTIYDNTAGARLQISSAGNVTTFAPSSGNALSATGASGATVFNATTAGSFGTGFNVNGPAANGLNVLTFAQSGQTAWAIYQAASDNAFRLARTGTDAFIIAGTGGVTLASPTSGNHQFNGLTQYSDGTTNAEIGWRSLPSSTFNGTLVVTQRSQLLQLNGNITVPNAVFSAGDVVVVTSSAGRTITQGASVTLTLGGTTTTGSRTLAANGVATILFTSASAALVYGAGVS